MTFARRLLRDSGDSFLLNTIPARAAYSLRGLSSANTPVVQVRRNTDSAQQDFTAQQIIDGTLAIFCNGGDGFVHTWYDQSGNANQLVQPNATAQPKIVSNGALYLFKNKPYIYFDAARVTRLTKDNSNIGGVSQFSASCIFVLSSGGVNGRLMSFRTLSSEDFVGTQVAIPFLQVSSTSVQTYRNNFISNNISITQLQPSSAFMSFDETNYNVRINGTSQTSSFAESSLASNLTLNLGMNNTTNGLYTGYMSEAIIYHKALNSSEINSLDFSQNYYKS